MAVCAHAKVMGVKALVDKQEVTVGETFLLQIQLDGDDSPTEPDLSELKDFIVQKKGGGSNNRESITIINGKVNRVSERGYIFNYSLTPKSEGLLTIPPIEVVAAGKTILTQPIPIRVKKPEETSDFKLRISLSPAESFVGQPIILTVTWFVNRNVEEFQFNLPLLEDPRFEIADLPEDKNYKGQDAILIHLPGGKTVARKGHETLHGIIYTTVTLRKILIPKQEGEISFEKASVVSRVLTGYEKKRSRQPFDDFFSRKRGVYKQFVTLSNLLSSKVHPLPENDQPADFTGLVGQYSIATEADPTEVNVGDPITLSIMVTGPEYLNNVKLPDLHKQTGLINNFKVPEEISPGEVRDRVKIFIQTIRAGNTNVEQIPSIRLSYFNPVTKQYEFARSEPIQLQVKSTRVVTALDAEGITPGEGKVELTTLDKGIAHNYVGEEVLVNQHEEVTSWLSSPFGLALIFFPPTTYLLVLVPMFIRRKRMLNGEAQQAKKALHSFSRELDKLKKDIRQTGLQGTAGRLVELIRDYLGKRLQMTAGSLVFTDVEEHLKRQGVNEASLKKLQEILDWCEAYHYGGIDKDGRDQDNLEKMLDDALKLFKKIDLCFRRKQ
jgi:hypothetical protein